MDRRFDSVLVPGDDDSAEDAVPLFIFINIFIYLFNAT